MFIYEGTNNLVSGAFLKCLSIRLIIYYTINIIDKTARGQYKCFTAVIIMSVTVRTIHGYDS